MLTRFHSIVVLLAAVGLVACSEPEQDPAPKSNAPAAKTVPESPPNSREEISTVLAYEVKPGDSLAKVESFMGKGVVQTGDDHAKLIEAVKGWQEESPDLYPAGAEAEDVFIIWTAPGCDQLLQFRNDQLINHDPKSYVATATPR